MTPYHQDAHLTVWQGDCRAVMAQMPAESVHTVVTSPPYWGLRDYGIGGQLGLEPTPEEFVENMVAVFREVRRVLRKDGTCWVNLGDSYQSNPGSGYANGDLGNLAGKNSARYKETMKSGHATKNVPRVVGLKPKDLVGIPWRVAFALQADGWYLRSDVIWSKPNPMPESVTDRPTKAHEYLFLLSKSPRYYYDADAVREAMAGSSIQRINQPTFDQQTGGAKDYANGTNPNRSARKALANFAAGRRTPAGWNVKHDRSNLDGRYEQDPDAMRPPEKAGRNLRTVWTIATQPYPGAHFATFPEKLVEPCVKAGTSERGVCPECGAPWRRMVEASGGLIGAGWNRHERDLEAGAMPDLDRRRQMLDGSYQRTTTGWQPSCAHDAEPVPAVVLDPFAGSGTTGRVAQRLGRRAVLIDLSGDYLMQAMARNADMPLGLIG